MQKKDFFSFFQNHLLYQIMVEYIYRIRNYGVRYRRSLCRHRDLAKEKNEKMEKKKQNGDKDFCCVLSFFFPFFQNHRLHQDLTKTCFNIYIGNYHVHPHLFFTKPPSSTTASTQASFKHHRLHEDLTTTSFVFFPFFSLISYVHNIVPQ